MKIFHQCLYALLVALLISACQKQKEEVAKSLPRSTPEAEGVSSEGILQFLEAADTSMHEFHSFMMLRHGKVIAEGWWNPYRPDLKHTMYSVSKSWTSTAAGFAVNEGLLSLDDKVISFFSDDLPDSISSYLSELTVKNLLSMSAGQEPDPSWRVATQETNWVQAFLRTPVLKKPGTEFLYNSLATHMVAAILQKVTEKNLIDYLRPRLFEPLAIEGVDCEVDPQGISAGGWGFRVKTEDMAKLGQLYLQQGKWNNQQLLPESWVKEATSAVIKDSAPYLPEDRKALSDWAQGYGYQFWRCRHNAFRADGAYGQYIIVIPEKDVVVVITSETTDMQKEIDLVWKFLLPAIKDNPLTENNAIVNKLRARLTSLALPVPQPDQEKHNQELLNKTFVFESNDMKYESIRIQSIDQDYQVDLSIDGIAHSFRFGSGAWVLGETTKLGPFLVPAQGHFVGFPPTQVAGSYSWSQDELELTLRYIESPHTERFKISLETDQVLRLTLFQSSVPGNAVLDIKGIYTP